MIKLLVLIAGIAVIIYAIANHKSRGKKKFYFLSYWKSLTPKGAVIYTVGLIISVYAVVFM